MADNKEKDQNPEAKTDDIPEEVGSVKVADEVLSIVASLAVAEIPGVAGMSGSIRGGLSEMLGKKDLTKGVKVSAEGKTAVLDVYVYIKYGANIPDVAINIQEKAKEAVENMTGYEVTAVNVHVEGIRRIEKDSFDEMEKNFNKEEAEEKEDESSQEDSEAATDIEEEREDTGTEDPKEKAEDADADNEEDEDK